ncbi:hypothetical protein BDP67DRAFT_525407 [Colletotrichum lupini]|nr:hypothetical protein BDP67DRAFT_525407 [Colletotrichum lupini]
MSTLGKRLLSSLDISFATQKYFFPSVAPSGAASPCPAPAPVLFAAFPPRAVAWSFVAVLSPSVLITVMATRLPGLTSPLITSGLRSTSSREYPSLTPTVHLRSSRRCFTELDELSPRMVEALETVSGDRGESTDDVAEGGSRLLRLNWRRWEDQLGPLRREGAAPALRGIVGAERLGGDGVSGGGGRGLLVARRGRGSSTVACVEVSQ